MKKVLVVVAVVMSFALVASAHAQNMKWDANSAMAAQELAKGKPFKFAGIEIVSVDPKAQIIFVKNPKTGRTAVARMGAAKYEGEYNGVADLKAGEMISGEGVQVTGENWVTKVMKATAGTKPMVAPKKD
jgi:hypothetical protein